MKRTNTTNFNNARRISVTTSLLFALSAAAGLMLFTPVYAHAEEIDEIEFMTDDDFEATYHYDYDDEYMGNEYEEAAEEEAVTSEVADIEVEEAVIEEASTIEEEATIEEEIAYEEPEVVTIEYANCASDSYYMDRDDDNGIYYNEDSEQYETYHGSCEEEEEKEEEYYAAIEKARREKEERLEAEKRKKDTIDALIEDPVKNVLKLDKNGNLSKYQDRDIISDVLADYIDAIPYVSIGEAVYGAAYDIYSQIKGGHYSVIQTTTVVAKAFVPFGRTLTKLFKWK